eukprot:1376726-Rhodomonas_salina.1
MLRPQQLWTRIATHGTQDRVRSRRRKPLLYLRVRVSISESTTSPPLSHPRPPLVDVDERRMKMMIPSHPLCIPSAT